MEEQNLAQLSLLDLDPYPIVNRAQNQLNCVSLTYSDAISIDVGPNWKLDMDPGPTNFICSGFVQPWPQPRLYSLHP